MANEITKTEFSALAQASKFPIADVIKTNFGSQGISPQDLLRVKVPSGGATSWEIMTKEGEKSVKEIEGIIIDANDIRLFFRKSFDETGGEEPPDCMSLDMVNGIGDPGGPCEKCEYNEWGSGKNGRGKACQQRKFMLFLPTNQFLPYVISAPVGSLKNMSDYFGRLTGEGLPYYCVVTKLSLEKDKNPDGITFSRIVPTHVRDLTDDEYKAMTKYRNAVTKNLGQAEVVAESDASDKPY